MRFSIDEKITGCALCACIWLLLTFVGIVVYKTSQLSVRLNDDFLGVLLVAALTLLISCVGTTFAMVCDKRRKNEYVEF